MKYKLLLLDIDGTLRPGSCERVPKENAEAVCAVQKAGVKIAIATGRGPRELCGCHCVPRASNARPYMRCILSVLYQSLTPSRKAYSALG